MQKPDGQKPAPLFIAIGGMVGVGKTTVGAALLSQFPGAMLIDADAERKKLFGVRPFDKLPDDAYSHDNIMLFIHHMHDVQRQALAAHPVVISTGTWLTARARQGAAEIAEEAGARLLGIWLDAPFATLFNRVTARAAEASVSDADVTVLERLASRTHDVPVSDDAGQIINAEVPAAQLTVRALMAIEARRYPLALPAPAAKPALPA